MSVPKVSVLETVHCCSSLNKTELNKTLFKRLEHNKNTCGNGSRLPLPKIRTSIGKKSFAYQGAMIYNQLNKSLRDETSLLRFKNRINQVAAYNAFLIPNNFKSFQIFYFLTDIFYSRKCTFTVSYFILILT